MTVRRVRTWKPRRRSEAGFGVVELVIGLSILVVGVSAIFAQFVSSAVTIQRASESTTALTLAESRFETFRALTYDQIGIDPAALNAADSLHKSDTAYAPGKSVDLPGSAFPPTETVTGADGRSYRLDTYIVWQTVAAGPAVKRIAVVVRKSGQLERELTRVESLFDQGTG